MNEIPEEDRCEACFGKGTLTTMKAGRWGHPMDLTQPVCPTCKGTGKKQKD
jgi:DnaJ-class molecular chaperone